MTASRFRPVLAIAAAIALAGCASVENFLSGDRIDYRSGGATAEQLDIPPDLTQLSRDGRYQQGGGVVSAAALQTGAAPSRAPAAQGPTVAPVATADLRIERAGDKRWLVTSLRPEQLWPQLQAFWRSNGFVLVIDQADTGIMETDWAENRAKIPRDGLRSLLGRVVEGLYSTGERDRFRTRVERTAAGSEVFISHRGMVEVYASQLRDATAWQPRPADPELEAEFLARLMVKLGVGEEQARVAVSTPPPAQPARARVLGDRAAATLQVDDNFDRAWRRVGLALDRGGFTVEDRDRALGLYFVRYVAPEDSKRAEPGFFARLFSSGKEAGGPLRLRVFVQGQGEASTVSVLNAQGGPDTGDVGKRIVSLLVDDLK